MAKCKHTQVIAKLMAAVQSLMDEQAGTRATNWGVVNDAMVQGQAALRDSET